jgi:hypothetical protein
LIKLDFQVGTSKKAHKILGKLAGRNSEEETNDTEEQGSSSSDKVSMSKKSNQKAPFEKMSDAYLFALVLGLSKGQKVKTIENKITYANFNSIERDIDVYSMIKIFGELEDVKDRDSIRDSIEKYATWGLLHINEHYSYGGDDFRLADLFL